MFLRQATAGQSRILGSFISSTDFITPMTALTIANTDIKLMKNGGASANKNSGGGTHRVNGDYAVTFDATDTATVGELRVSVVVAGALPYFTTFWVVEEAVYDSLYAAAGDNNIATLALIKAVTDLLTAAQAAPSAPPAANATPLAKLGWMFVLARNRITETTTQQQVFADDDVTAIAAAATSDVLGVTTRGKFA